MDPDVVDQAVADQRRPLVRAVEQLAHRNRRRALLPDDAEPLDVFRRKRVFQKEQPEPLALLAKPHSLDRRNPLVHVMQQLDLFAQLLPRRLQQLQRAPQIILRLEHRSVVQLLHLHRPRARAVARLPRHAHLHPDVAEALRHQLARVVDHFRNLAPAGVRVTVGRLAALAAEQLIHGHPRHPSLDVPQRLVHPADGVVQNRPVAPVRGVVHRLPQVVDAVSGLARQKRPQVPLHRRRHQLGALRVCGAAVPVEPVLVRDHLHHRQPQALRRRGDHLHVPDARRRHAPHGARRGLLRLRLARRQRGGGHGSQQASALHGLTSLPGLRSSASGFRSPARSSAPGSPA
jgi:hypothetical protein